MAQNTKGKKFKKKRNFSNSKVKSDKFMDDYRDSKYGENPTNDPSWYAQYPELMRDAASIPYSIPTGTYVKWNVNTDSSTPLIEDASGMQYNPHESVPGIMTLGVCPTPGISTGPTSPVNVATKMLYTKVRAENSGARNYDAPDLMLYCLALDQIYSLLTWYNRIYGTIMLYSQVNRYIPRELLKAQWIDFDDLILHINDFKAFLDTATAQAAVFSVPNDMKLFNRHAFMYQNVYKDAESAKAQLYQFAPRILYYYDEYNGAGRLMPYDIINSNPNGIKFADMITIFHTLMDPVIASEDFNIMSGDVLKAFGPGNLLKLQIMPQGYTIIPVADYEVLTQIKNATMSNFTNSGMLVLNSTPAEWSVHQDANVEYIEFNPRLVVKANAPHAFSYDRYLSTYKTAPEPADNMVYSRLMWTTHEEINPDDNTKYDVFFDSLGSEFITGVNITAFHYDSNHNWVTGSTAINVVSDTTIGSSNVSTVNFYRFFLCKHFDFCPAIYAFIVSSTDTVFYPFFDLDNWTIVHSYELEKMHRTALMSMLRVPMIGSALPANLKA